MWLLNLRIPLIPAGQSTDSGQHFRIKAGIAGPGQTDHWQFHDPSRFFQNPFIAIALHHSPALHRSPALDRWPALHLLPGGWL